MAYLGLSGQYGIAHRGGAGEALENSPAAFANALSLGYQVVETDVHVTADGVLAISHDRDLRRTAGERTRIENLSWPELKRRSLRNGERMMRFEEIWELAPALRVNVDPKSAATVAPLIDFLKANPDLHDRVCIGSFSAQRLQAVRSALPNVATSLGRREILQLMMAVRTGVRFTFHESVVAVQIPPSKAGVRIVTPAFVDFVRNAGRDVQVWTIDAEHQMRQLFAIGVNGVMTDQPTLLRQVMQDLGIW